MNVEPLPPDASEFCANCGHQRASHEDGMGWCRVGHTEQRMDVAMCGCTGFVGSGVSPTDAVHHPTHYGGDTVYEAIKVIEAWQLGFNLGNTVKYIARAGKKPDPNLTLAGRHPALGDLRKAAWYLSREIEWLEGK